MLAHSMDKITKISIDIHGVIDALPDFFSVMSNLFVDG